MASPRSILFLADVGGPATWHVGDEAMLDANVALFRRLLPGAEIMVASGDPAATAARLGVTSVARLDLNAITSTRGADLEAIAAMVAATCAGAPPAPAMAAMVSADALVISGGGNLCSRWPLHILERFAMANLAHALGKPVFILGQTIGPWLSAEDRPVVGALLGTACWVGVREAASHALAREILGTAARLHLQDDDAASLVPEGFEPPPTPPVVLLTLHPFLDLGAGSPGLGALTAELRALTAATGAELAFLPHATPRNPGEQGDLDVAAALARELPLRVLQMPDVTEAVAAARRANLIVSSRYHPLVFGLAAGVPCLGLPVDEYTRVKLHGALAGRGQQAALFPMDRSGCEGLADAAMRLWDRRCDIRAELATASVDWRRREALRHMRLAACLAGDEPAREPAEDWLTRQLGFALAARGEEVVRLDLLRADWAELLELRRSRQAMEAYALDLRAHLDRCLAELPELRMSRQEVTAYALDLKAHLDRCQAELARSNAAAAGLRAEVERLRGGIL